MKVIFLDRDGVINRFPGKGVYVTSLEQFEFLPNAKRAIELLTKAGYGIFVVSNQGCISRGLITEEGLRKITERMLKEIEKEGGQIKGVFYCPHQTADHCECKKPKAGLFKKALSTIKNDPPGVIHFIGDSQEDVEAGKNLGFRTVLVLSGRTAREDLERFDPKPDFVKDDLMDAARWLAQKKS